MASITGARLTVAGATIELAERMLTAERIAEVIARPTPNNLRAMLDRRVEAPPERRP